MVADNIITTATIDGKDLLLEDSTSSETADLREELEQGGGLVNEFLLCFKCTGAVIFADIGITSLDIIEHGINFTSEPTFP